MKKKKNFGKIEAVVITVLIILGTTTTVTVYGEGDNPEEMPDEITLNYSFTQPQVTEVMIDDILYHRVTMEDLPSAGETRAPILPVKPVNVLLPQRNEVESINVTYTNNISLGYGYNVELGNEPVIIGEQNQPNETLNYDPTQPYPTTLIVDVGANDFRGYSILTLNLFPVHYIGETGELYYYSEMTVNIKTNDTGIVNPFFRGLLKDELLLQQKVDDNSMAYTYVFPAEEPTSQSSPVDPAESYQYVIITNNELKNSFQEFKDFKNDRGTPTTIVTMEEILNCYDYEWDGEFGDGFPFFEPYIQCNIRNFIKDAYINWETEYILLGGDDEIIPHRGLYCFIPVGQFIWDYDIPADIYYGCLDGSFNRNRDDKWGEIIDLVDLQAEVYVGRACVSNSEEVSIFISKTTAYIESTEPYLGEVLLVGEHLTSDPDIWGGDYMDEMIDGSNANGYTTVGIPSDEYNIVTLYDRDWLYPPGWPKSEIINHINSGTHIINHIGHSNIGDNMKMVISDVDSLTNTKYCFIYSQGCYAGAFDNYGSGSDCIAEYFTVKNPSGAFAGVWNSRYGWGNGSDTNGPSQMFAREFFDAVYGESINDFRYRQLGVAHQDSKEDNIWRLKLREWDSFENIGMSMCVRWCYFNLNLFGDPQIEFKPAVVPEHDIAVTYMDAPKYVNPDEFFTVDANIFNEGTSDESNVLVKLIVDDSIVNDTLIPFIESNHLFSVSFTSALPYGIHSVELEAQPVLGEDITGDNVKTTTITSDHPPEKPAKPWGETQCKLLEICTYYSNTTDLDGDQLRYKWKWDVFEGFWTWRLYESGDVVSRSHIWLLPGTYSVRVKAVDTLGRESNWSEKLFVSATSSSNSCFLAGTQITMNTGSTKNIEDVKVGDMVKSYDTVNNRIVDARVTKVYHHDKDEMTDYYLVINKKIDVTPNHPLYINSKWQSAENADLGDCLFGIDGDQVKIISIEKVFRQLLTYNFEIDTYHNYFADGILAHNAKNAAAISTTTISDDHSHHANN